MSATGMAVEAIGPFEGSAVKGLTRESQKDEVDSELDSLDSGSGFPSPVLVFEERACPSVNWES